jgi:hypothetical protein
LDATRTDAVEEGRKAVSGAEHERLSVDRNEISQVLIVVSRLDPHGEAVEIETSIFDGGAQW